MPTLDLTNRKSSEQLNTLAKPTNEGLDTIFYGVDKVVIKLGGVHEDKAITDEVVLTILALEEIKMFNELLKIDEEKTGFYCMCAGTYAIELYSNNKVKATIGFHHGVSIRYDQWNGDAELTNSDRLLDFLAELGLTQPLQDRMEEKRNMEATKVIERKWLELAPKSFQKYWEEICAMDNGYLPHLITDLNIEIPDRESQIIRLLQTFGRTENFWTNYPSYEELPYDILKTFSTEEIIKTYIDSDRNYKTRRGLGRYLCSFDFRRQRRSQLECITLEVIDDLEKCFDHIGDARGVNEIISLRKEKEKT